MPHKKPFVSEATLKMGRNRAHRTLERQTDGMGIEEIVGEKIGSINSPCKHNDYCNVRVTIGREICYTEYTKSCRTYKFYERYGK